MFFAFQHFILISNSNFSTSFLFYTMSQHDADHSNFSAPSLRLIEMSHCWDFILRKFLPNSAPVCSIYRTPWNFFHSEIGNSATPAYSFLRWMPLFELTNKWLDSNFLTPWTWRGNLHLALTDLIPPNLILRWTRLNYTRKCVQIYPPVHLKSQKGHFCSKDNPFSWIGYLNRRYTIPNNRSQKSQRSLENKAS